MIRPASGAVRATRALTLGGVLGGVSVTFHLAAGGSTPGPVATAVVGAALAVVAAQLTRRRLGVPAITAVLAAGQVILHYALMATSAAAAACAPAAAAPAHGMHTAHGSHAALPMDCAGSAMAGMPGMTAAAVPGAAMLLAHLVATVLGVVLLAGGERAVWALATLWAWLSPRLVPPFPAPSAAPVVRRRAAGHRPVRAPGRAVYLRVSPRRGPPTTAGPALVVATA